MDQSFPRLMTRMESYGADIAALDDAGAACGATHASAHFGVSCRSNSQFVNR